MKIEVGTLYRLRDGSKARIYATDGNHKGFTKIHGAIFKDQWIQGGWSLDGRYLPSQETPYDIISEWGEIEPSEEQAAAAMESLIACGLGKSA